MIRRCHRLMWGLLFMATTISCYRMQTLGEAGDAGLGDAASQMPDATINDDSNGTESETQTGTSRDSESETGRDSDIKTDSRADTETETTMATETEVFSDTSTETTSQSFADTITETTSETLTDTVVDTDTATATGTFEDTDTATQSESASCEEVFCGDHGVCIPSAFGVECLCDDGFESVALFCVDIDECAIGSAACGPDEVCVNLTGGYQCRPQSCGPYYLGTFGGSAKGVRYADGRVYVANGTGGLFVYDMTYPANPQHLGRLNTQGEAFAVDAVDELAYVAEAEGLDIIDTTDAGHLVLLSHAAGSFRKVKVAQGMAYALGTAGTPEVAGLHIFDVANPTAPILIHSVDLMSVPSSVEIQGDFAFVAKGYEGLQVVDIGIPADAVVVGSLETTNSALDIAVKGDTAYIAAWLDGLLVVDVSDPTNPKLTAQLKAVGDDDGATGVYATESMVVLLNSPPAHPPDGSNSRLSLIDVSDPLAPSSLKNIDIPSSANAVHGDGAYAFVADGTEGIQAVDIATPETATVVSGISTPVWVNGMASDDSSVYVASGDVYILDVRDWSNPRMTADVVTPGSAMGVATSGRYLYVAAWDAGLQIFDVTDKAAPVIVGSADTPGTADAVAVSGDLAYVLDRDYSADGSLPAALHIFDIADRSNPQWLSTYDALAYADGFSVADGFVYVADRTILAIIDARYPAAPVLAATLEDGISTRDVRVSDGYAYLINPFRIYDISDPYQPSLRSSIEVYGDDIDIYEGNAYLAATGFPSALYTVDVQDPVNPVVRADDLLPQRAEHIHVADGIAYVGDQMYGSGVSMVDVTTPASAAVVSVHDTAGANASQIAMVGDTVYLTDEVTDGIGIEAVDVANPAEPRFLGRQELASTAYGGASGLYVTDNLAYVLSSDSLFVLDVSEPENMTLMSSIDSAGNSEGLAVEVPFAYLAQYDNGLQIVDTTNPASPLLRGLAPMPAPARGVAVQGSFAYVAVESLGLQVVDVEDPDQPVLRGIVAPRQFSWKVTVVGERAYVLGISDLTIVDISDPDAPQELGYVAFDGRVENLVVKDNRVFVTSTDNGVLLVDISDSTQPILEMDAIQAYPGEPRGVVEKDDLLYIATEPSGLVVLDPFECPW